MAKSIREESRRQDNYVYFDTAIYIPSYIKVNSFN
jgi:hypothetical protein